MEYFDTNLFVYSFLNKDLPKGKLSTERIDNCIKNDKLIISSLIVKEFVYVLSKNKISPDVILDYYNGLKKFINYVETEQILSDCMNLCKELNNFKTVNDVFHLKFAEKYCEKLITFDKDFERFRPYTKLEIEILN